jgi:hypothetical protein
MIQSGTVENWKFSVSLAGWWVMMRENTAELFGIEINSIGMTSFCQGTAARAA